MQDIQVPYLCGGTFFVLLTEAKRKGPTRRQMRAGIPDRVTYKDMLEALIRFPVPSFRRPAMGRTFEGDTSDYRACKVEFGENLPFDEALEIQAFDKKGRTEYGSVLAKMDSFAESYLWVDSEERMRWLVQALLTLIETDELIAPETPFYLSGTPVTKAELLSLDHYRLSALLLSVWHFVIMNRPDNLRGRATFEAWHERADEMNAKWRFTSEIGKAYPREISFDLPGGGGEPEDGGGSRAVGDSGKTSQEDAGPTVEVYERPYIDPITNRQVLGQFHVENHGNGIAAGIVYGGITIGGRKRDGE